LPLREFVGFVVRPDFLGGVGLGHSGLLAVAAE